MANVLVETPVRTTALTMHGAMDIYKWWKKTSTSTQASPFLTNTKDTTLRAQTIKAQQTKPSDPFTSETDMYLGNQMAQQMDPDTPRHDTLIRDSKGFGHWSFKKHPSQNKKHKKKEQDAA